MAEKETAAERRARIEKEVAERSAARKEAYFEKQTAAKEAAAAKLPPVPAPDAFNYQYAWRQEVGGPGGNFKLVKTPNPYYDVTANEIIDPATGKRTPAKQSMYGGVNQTTATLTNVVGQNYGSTNTGNMNTGNVNNINTGFNQTGNINQTGMMTNPYAPGTAAAENWNERKSAYDMLYSEFAKYGLQSLVVPLQGLIQSGVSPSEFTIQLRNTDAYRQRFGANQARIQKGLRALSEAEYIGLEDQYQDVMRRYGLPETYYKRGDMGRQEGFEKFISSDVSPVELEDRVQTAYNRVINANPEVGIALRNFYPNITNGDILAYALDPNKALNEIQRKITAAEIGGAAVQAGLTTNESDADYLARYGITKEQAQQGYRTISGYLPRAQQLSSIYGKQVEGGPYTQASAEREVFNVPGAAEEERKRQKITSLEQASFSGSSGLTSGALARDRAGSFQAC